MARRSFKVQFKLSVAQYACEHSSRKAAKKFKIDRRVVDRWVKNKIQLAKVALKKQRSYVRLRRRCFFPDLEKELFDYIKDVRNKGTCVTGPMILNKAAQIARDKNINNFEGFN